MSQQTIIKKIPLPIIRVEQVTPDDEKEKKFLALLP